MFKRLSAEFLGTFWLVFGGCGSAVLAAAFPEVGIGLLGVSFAFGQSRPVPTGPWSQHPRGQQASLAGSPTRALRGSPGALLPRLDARRALGGGSWVPMGCGL